jgi:hypothetical protein
LNCRLRVASGHDARDQTEQASQRRFLAGGFGSERPCSCSSDARAVGPSARRSLGGREHLNHTALRSSACVRQPMSLTMRSLTRPFAAVIGIAFVFLVSAPFVRGLVLIIWALALVGVVLVALANWIRRRQSSPVPWVVSLAVSAITTTPEFIFAHYRHLAGRVSGGLLYWLVGAAFLRLVIFLADYFRNRSDRLHASA